MPEDALFEHGNNPLQHTLPQPHRVRRRALFDPLASS
jgi:hypothetical protein